MLKPAQRDDERHLDAVANSLYPEEEKAPGTSEQRHVVSGAGNAVRPGFRRRAWKTGNQFFD